MYDINKHGLVLTKEDVFMRVNNKIISEIQPLAVLTVVVGAAAVVVSGATVVVVSGAMVVVVLGTVVSADVVFKLVSYFILIKKLLFNSKINSFVQ